MKISVIIPTLNRVDYLRQAIDSALAQDYPDLEIIVADNASDDATPDLLENYGNIDRLTYRRNDTNQGMVANWADAVENLATGEWFLIMSDDDYFVDSGYISAAARLIERNPGLSLVMSNGYILDETTGDKRELALPHREVESGIAVFLSRGKVLPQDFTLCNVLFRRQMALQMDVFSNPDNISCDSELFLKLCLLGDVGVNQSVATVYRLHSTNFLRATETDEKILLASFDAYLAPYEMAQSLQAEGSVDCSEQQLAEWRDRVLVRTARYILIHARLSHRKSLTRITEYLDSRLPGIVGQVESRPLFRIKCALLPFWRLWLSWRRKLASGLA